jgi:hypothetical protein
MSAESIVQVTRALRSRLQQALADVNDPGAVFIGPLDDPDAQGASLILFLYRMVPNASLRNSEHRVAPEQPNLPAITHTRSLPLDLYYLVTVGTRAGSAEDPLLRVLGFAIRALNDLPNLVGEMVAQETVRVTMEPLSTEEISRIWSLFPTVNYRTSIAYLASPVWVDPAVVLPPERAVTRDGPLAGQRRKQGSVSHA